MRAGPAGEDRMLTHCGSVVHSLKPWGAYGRMTGREHKVHPTYTLTYMSMVRTTVYLDQEIALALRQLAARRGRSQAELIRDALASYTRRAVRPTPKGIGKYRSGEPDVAQRAKDILGDAAKRGRWR